MQDRNVEFPNRFRMVKVEGTDDIYDVIPAPGDVLNPGTLLNKANLLTDEVARQMGLKMAEPTPNDMFGVLANIGNVHVWKRITTLSETTYKPVVGEVNYNVTLDRGDKLYYSDSVDIASLQDINLASPVSTFSFDGYSVPSVVGKYIRKNDGPTIYIYPASNQSITGSTLWLRKCREISAAVDTPAGTHTDFVTSTDSTAYPRDGDVGDCHYTYLGQLGGGARIEVGSYVGTGTYGSSNPTMLTFEFRPKFVFIVKDTGGSTPVRGTFLPLAYGQAHSNGVWYAANSDYYPDMPITWNENSVSFYSRAKSGYQAETQMNSSGKTYYTLAIG